MLVFRCSRTGLYYPSDYVENWGLKYGRGLGPTPVSEAVVNQYNRKISIGKYGKMVMHPIGYCYAQVDAMEISEEEYAQHVPILVIDDPRYVDIGQIMRDKQLQKSPKLQAMFPDEVKLAAERIAARIQKNIELFAPTRA